MRLADFDYALPPESIAQEAVEPRDAARLLHLGRTGGACTHHAVRDLPALLAPGDLLVVNDTRVVPARVHATKSSGGAVEVLFLEREGEAPAGEAWRVLLGASRAPRPGAALALPGGARATVLDAPGEGGLARIAVEAEGGVAAWLDAHGAPPLPPYIRRAPGDARLARDRERYQTVFAREPGAVAAPTAGLHFTPGLIAALAARGIATARVTLHVGEGTFRPLTVDRLADVALHDEAFAVPEATSTAIAATRAAGGRVVAVGTTVVRTLESRPPDAAGGPAPGAGRTSLFIAPGHRFRYVDALFTNFHLPRSSLLVLVAAFGGRERVLAAYRQAVATGYRFYSYGDAMLVT